MISRYSTPGVTKSQGVVTAVFAVLLAALATAVFIPALTGDFVYDDQKQILENHLIQDPERLGQALTSDVWAFKGWREEAWSNYWRPVFVAWLAANHAVFGLRSAVGWHAANLALHAGVVLATFLLLLRLRSSIPLAAAVAAIFAVHPAHVESVAWVSGSPDLLAALPQLLALLLLLPESGPQGRGRWLGALGLHALALGAKEIAVVFPVLVATAIAGRAAEDGLPRRAALGRGLVASLPFVALGAVFLVARGSVLGMVEVETPWRTGPAGLLLTAPSLLAFYLRQALFPAWLGPSYPLRAVTPENAGLENFVLPLAAVAAAAGVAVWLVRSRPRLWLGPVLFFVPLLPALNVNAFIPEQVVHDRYLYLPLLGFWLTVLGALWMAAEGRARETITPATMAPDTMVPDRRSPGRLRRGERAVLVAAALVAVLFAAQTVRYSRAWRTELALWQWGVRSDPGSSFNRAQLGHALLVAGRPDEALAALDDALAIRPVTSALLDRARILAARGELEAAERDLRLVQADQPDNPHPYEQLAVVLERSGRRAEAVAELARGRQAVPYRRCALTSNLAVLLYLDGNKEEALAELEGVQDLVGVEAGPVCALAAFHLGSLYRELGRPAESRRALERYLEASGSLPDEESRRRRQMAQRMLESTPR